MVSGNARNQTQVTTQIMARSWEILISMKIIAIDSGEI